MEMLFLLCAAVGGAVMLFQFGMALVGLSHDGGDLGHGSGHVDVMDDPAHVDVGGTHWIEAAGAVDDVHQSSWLFSILSFRTLVAALAFFGMAGMASTAAGLDVVQSFVIAIAAGGAAMYGVYTLMRAIHSLRSDGNVRIQGALGRPGTVYIPIPAGKSGAGKIQLNLQNRTVEYEAMTDDQTRLPTGTRIVVVRILGPDTVQVERLAETAEVADA